MRRTIVKSCQIFLIFLKEKYKIIRQYVLCLLVVCFIHCQQTSFHEDIPLPPEAKVDVVTETAHGIVINDPYRYMENLKDSYVIDWMRAQNDYARKVFSKILGRDDLKARIKEIEESIPAHIGNFRQKGNRFFYLKETKEDEIAKLYFRDGLHGEETLLVDPMTFGGKAGESFAINYYEPSWDGTKVAIGISCGGSEDAVLRFISVDSRKVYHEEIDRARFGLPAWHPDGSSVFYLRLRQMEEGEPPHMINIDSEVYWHLLGSDPKNDIRVLSRKHCPELEMQASDFPAVVIFQGIEYLFGLVLAGAQKEFSVYMAPISSLGSTKIPWVPVFKESHKIVGFNVFNNQIYCLTYKGAPRFKLIRTSLEEPNFEAPETIIPESSAILNTFTLAQDGLYAEAMEAGLSKILRLSWEDTETIEDVTLPFEGAAGLENAVISEMGVFFTLQSWIQSIAYFRYDPVEKKVIRTGLKPAGPHDSPEGMTSREVLVESHDGTMVPLSIVHHEQIKYDGKNPVLLTGYGAYGISMNPRFNPNMLAWIEKGGMWAVAHVRGGGEYGDDWHRAGQKKNKPNSWKDFIACAEYLIEEGYTEPKKLAALGVSAGGITIGRAMTERPDLFKAVCIAVGDLNSTRAHLMPSGPANYPEFGNPENPEEFRYLLEMDSYQNVKDEVEYPAVLLMTGLNDPKISAWMPSKMAARLLAASISRDPILLRVDFKGGHGTQNTKAQNIEATTDALAFCLWQLGVF